MRLTSFKSVRSARSDAKPPISREWAFSLIAVGLFLVFVLDRVTGEAPFQHLYYLPIILAALRFGRRGGLTAALLAVVFYHLASPRLIARRYGQSDIIQIALFIAVGIVTAKLKNDALRLRRLAMTDDLTGLHNLRSFEARLMMAVRASRESGEPVSLLVLDVDRLKALNDQHGHLTGAEAVRAVGQIIAGSVPPSATACRFGGDEFVVALPRCSPSETDAIARALCSAVNAVAPVLAGRAFPAATLSVSVGLASHSFDDGAGTARSSIGDEAIGEELFRAADEALYSAKAAGRNRVAAACALPAG